jgi:hypothetical protein
MIQNWPAIKYSSKNRKYSAGLEGPAADFTMKSIAACLAVE